MAFCVPTYQDPGLPHSATSYQLRRKMGFPASLVSLQKVLVTYIVLGGGGYGGGRGEGLLGQGTVVLGGQGGAVQ